MYIYIYNRDINSYIGIYKYSTKKTPIIHKNNQVQIITIRSHYFCNKIITVLTRHEPLHNHWHYYTLTRALPLCMKNGEATHYPLTIRSWLVALKFFSFSFLHYPVLVFQWGPKVDRLTYPTMVTKPTSLKSYIYTLPVAIVNELHPFLFHCKHLHTMCEI